MASGVVTGDRGRKHYEPRAGVPEQWRPSMATVPIPVRALLWCTVVSLHRKPAWLLLQDRTDRATGKKPLFEPDRPDVKAAERVHFAHGNTRTSGETEFGLGLNVRAACMRGWYAHR